MPAPRARLLALCLAPLVFAACAGEAEAPATASAENDDAKKEGQSRTRAAEPVDEIAQAGPQQDAPNATGLVPNTPAPKPAPDPAALDGLAEQTEFDEDAEEPVEEEEEEAFAAEPEPAAAEARPLGGIGEGSGSRPDAIAKNEVEREKLEDALEAADDIPEAEPPPEPKRKSKKKAKASGGPNKGGSKTTADDRSEDSWGDGNEDGDKLAADKKTLEEKPTETVSKEAPADRGIGGEAPGGGGYEPKQGKDEGRFGGQPSPLDDLPIVAGDDEPEVHTRRYGVNRTVEVAAEPILRFAASLDLASFHLCQLALASGRLPDPGAVRVESFLAAASLTYPSPAEDEPVAVTTSTMESQSREGFYVLRVGVTAPAAPSSSAPVVFAVAVADEDDRVKRVRAALAKTVQQAQKEGVPVAIATPGKALEPEVTGTQAKKRFRNLTVEGTLPPALDRAYTLAESIGAQKIVLVSDGMPDGRVRDPAALVRTIDTHAANGVRLSVAGVGNDHYDDGLLELLSRAGRGRYEHGTVDDKASLMEVAAADAVAQDLELELVFSPEHVSRYRLVGYERRLAGRRGEIFAPGKGGLRPGESITALVEYKPKQDASGPIALVRAHYLDRKGSRREVEVDAEFEDELQPDETVALVAAGLAEKLRGAYWARTLTYDDLADALASLPPEVAERSSVKALAQMVTRAKALDDRPDRFAEEQPLGGMSFDALPLQ